MLTKIKLSRNCKSANLSNLQNGSQRQAQISKFSFKRKRTAWNKRKDKTMTLDTQVNLAESDKVSFYNQKEWLEEYEHGKGKFCSEYSQKQPPEVFCENRRSYKFHKIHRKTPVSHSLF